MPGVSQKQKKERTGTPLKGLSSSFFRYLGTIVSIILKESEMENRFSQDWMEGEDY